MPGKNKGKLKGDDDDGDDDNINNNNKKYTMEREKIYQFWSVRQIIYIPLLGERVIS